MKHSVSHGLSREQAKKVAEAALESYKQKFADYSPSCTWTSDHTANITFKVMGKTLQGSIEVGDNDIDLGLDVPLMMRPFKSKALGVIEQEIRGWIAKSKVGEI